MLKHRLLFIFGLIFIFFVNSIYGNITIASKKKINNVDIVAFIFKAISNFRSIEYVSYVKFKKNKDAIIKTQYKNIETTYLYSYKNKNIKKIESKEHIVAIDPPRSSTNISRALSILKKNSGEGSIFIDTIFFKGNCWAIYLKTNKGRFRYIISSDGKEILNIQKDGG